jgi:single-strand DNA-binding protein
MPLPLITGVARLVADPELRFTQSSKAVATVRLAFNARRLNAQTQQWEDGDTFWVRGTAWEQMAENIVETLQKGMEVLVSGELKTESWEKDGVKHQQPALAIRSIGPNLAYAVAQVSKPAREQAPAQQGQRAQQRPQQAQQRPAAPNDDPWATGFAADDQPPF